MAFILFKERVKDLAKWKEIYDSRQKNCVEAGIIDKYVLRGATDDNEVILLREEKDMGRAKAFIEAPQLRDAMEKSGVIGKPDIYFINDEYRDLAKASGF